MMTIKRTLYQRQRWGQSFRIAREKVNPDHSFRDPERVHGTLTRWFGRCVERAGGVLVLGSPIDMLVVERDPDGPVVWLGAMVDAWKDVAEEHRDRVRTTQYPDDLHVLEFSSVELLPS